METPQIVSDPRILMGKPCVAGTRISVELILEKFGAGRVSSNCSRRTPGYRARPFWQRCGLPHKESAANDLRKLRDINLEFKSL